MPHLVNETHFALGRVRVHVYVTRGQAQVKEQEGLGCLGGRQEHRAKVSRRSK